MVCPNCHSDRIIAVQDQFFCINCGQQVPNPQTGRAKPSVAVGADGLPEGVKILPLAGNTAPTISSTPTAKLEKAPKITKSDKSAAKTAPAKATPAKAESSPLIKQRSRIGVVVDAAEPNPSNAPMATPSAAPTTPPIAASGTKTKKRKPGRPKAGRLDVPKTVTATIAPAAEPVPPDSPATPSVNPATTPTTSPAATITEPATATGPRRLNDLAPRRHRPHAHANANPVSKTTTSPEAPTTTDTNRPAIDGVTATPKPTKKPRAHVHKVGVPPLHYGHIMSTSLRARVKGRWVFLGSLAAASLAAVVGYFTWLFLNGGLPAIASALTHATPLLIGEAALLAVLYYIGRSVGQGAVIYGITREADARPVPLSHQIGVGINTFGRRFSLDLLVGMAELVLIVAGAKLLLEGGSWDLAPQLHIGLLFAGFLGILYLLTALALTRGLAGVAITISNQSPVSAAKLGWRLFSHRPELLALRFLADTMELLLAVPLAALALALILTVPEQWHLPVAIAVGLLAWLAGALFGAGTAAWWSALYRRLVKVEQPADTATLLAGYNTESPQPGPLTAVVAFSSFVISAALALPWLKIF